MITSKKIECFDMNFKKIKEVSFDFEETENTDHQLYLALKYQNSKNRAGTACVKSRGEVRGGGAKPYKQKGTGRARRGTNNSPLIRGGGVIFGPTPRAYASKVNKKVMLNAIATVFARKSSNLIFLNSKEIVGSKVASDVLSKIGSKYSVSLKKVLLIVDSNSDWSLYRGFNNIKNCYTMSITSLNLQELLFSDFIIMSDNTVSQFEKVFKK
jgi:large subunit ribosomal protein L4